VWDDGYFDFVFAFAGGVYFVAAGAVGGFSWFELFAALFEFCFGFEPVCWKWYSVFVVVSG